MCSQAIWHDREYKDSDLDVEAAICLPKTITAAPITVRRLDGATVASIVHHGAFNRIAGAYQAVLRWIEANRMQPAGPVRELFLHVSQPASRDDESNVTEIQVPVERIP